MKLWRPTFGAPIFKLASSCSLFLLVVAAAWAFDYQGLDARLSATNDPAEAARILKAAAPEIDPDLRQSIDDLDAMPPAYLVDNLKWEIAQRAMRQGVDEPGTAGDAARRIKSNPLFGDRGDKESSNWLGQAFQRLSNLFKGRDRVSQPPRKLSLPSGSGGLGLLTPIVWFLLGAGILAFAYYALRHVSFKKGLKRRGRAVLEDDEPERTLDEWLGQADDLAAQGRYREAVRALYLACLLKFDEKRVARFVRGETNWEHLARIRTSALLPPGLDFRPSTQAFDLIWYGHQVNAMVDVDRFRGWYGETKTALEGLA